MNKLLRAGLLGLAVLTVVSVPVQARTFGLCIRHKCRSCCDGCSVCIRPYNAFTPVVSGTLIADGCFPFSGGFAPGGAPGWAPPCAIGDPCAALTPDSAEMAAAQYQYLMYQQQLAAQNSMYQQHMTAQQPMPYAPVRATGYAPAYNYYGAMPMLQQLQPVEQAHPFVPVGGNR